MTRTRRGARGALAVLAVVLATALVSGCTAGLQAQTSQSYDPTNGAEVSAGDVRVANLLVVSGVDGGELTGGFVNDGESDDALTAVTIETAPPITMAEPIQLPHDTNVTLGPPGTTRIFVHDLGAKPGQLVHVTMTFRDAGIAETDVLVTATENLAAGG